MVVFVAAKALVPVVAFAAAAAAAANAVLEEAAADSADDELATLSPRFPEHYHCGQNLHPDE